MDVHLSTDPANRHPLVATTVLGLVFILALPGAGRAADLSPAAQRAIDRAVAYLKGRGSAGAGYDSLGAYAMLKAGVPASDPAVAKVVATVVAACNGGKYTRGSETAYVPGVDLMLLEAADAQKYKPQIQTIVNFLVAKQLPNGGWDYMRDGGAQGGGDTSQSQYALLGLWAGQRAGAQVPTATWDRAARWHVTTQRANGGFVYHPQTDSNSTTLSLTGNAVSSLIICRMYLYPDAGAIGSEERRRAKPKSTTKFGVLERVDLDTVESDEKTSDEPVQGATVTLTAIDAALKRALNFMTVNYRVEVSEWGKYYLYAVERMCALADLPAIGTHDWYAEGSAHFIKTQQADGSWQGSSGSEAGAAFGILFLTRATGKLLNRDIGGPALYGSGLLVGGRGLPDNLGRVEMEDGRAKARKIAGPLDELLAELEKLDSANVQSAQAAIVEQFQVGDPEALVGQTDRLLKLVEDPRAEVRRTAYWAIGQTGDLDLARVLVEGLRDEDIGVVIDARNALCTLTRLPRGQGEPPTPGGDLPETATDAERREAETKWREEVREAWEKWYLRSRPYDERDDLFISDSVAR